jgi:hypothetical protein
VERVEVRRLGRVDVDVVVLDRGHDGDLGPVVPELRRLLEESGVVFVPLDDERHAREAALGVHEGRSRLVLLGRDAQAQGRWTRRRRRTKARLEVLGQAPDEEARPFAGGIEQPRGHRARRRLAVRSGDDQGTRVVRRDDQIDEGMRHRRHAKAGIDRGLRLDVVAPAYVPHDDQVGPIGDVRRIEPAQAPHAPSLELRAHGRIERDVRAGHLVPDRPEQAGQGPHSAPRHADAMDAHVRSTGCDG